MKLVNRWLSSQPIRNKVLVFGILMSSVPLFIVSFYYFVHTKIDLEKRINEKQMLVLKNLSTEIGMEFDLTFQRLQKLSLTNTRHDTDYYQLLQQNESIEEIVMTNEKGQVEKRISRYKLNLPHQGEKWFSDDMWFSFQNNDKSYGEVEFNEFGQPVVKLSVPLFENGSRKGIGVVIQLQKIIGEISSIKQDPSSYLYLMNQNGEIIANQDYSKLWQKKTNTNPDSVLGVKEKIKGLNWTLVMEQPKAIAYEPINKMFQEGLLVVAIFTFLVSLISVYAGLFFTKPIMMLDKAMKKLKMGEKINPLPYQQLDEMGKLVESFNEMSLELQEKSRRIEQEKEQLNVVLKGIGAGLALVTKEYKITWMNPLLKKLLGENHFHLPCYQLMGESLSPCQDCIITCPKMDDCADKLMIFEDANGVNRIYRHRVFPLTHVVDGEAEFLLFIEDVTEQKEIEEKIAQTDKLAALGLMASSFAHEVNNPLTTINVYAEDLIDRIGVEDTTLDYSELTSYLKKIKDNTIRCKKITGNLLNFSRKSNWTISNIDLQETLQNTLSLVEYSLRKKKIDLSVNLGTIPPFNGDSLKLMQVLVNLLNNSIDSIESNGLISISAEMVKEQLEIVVKDNGAGIPHDVLPKIFDPFYTTKEIGKGTGLGLSVCYGIIQQFGGSIQILSDYGSGTNVTIRLPIQPEERKGTQWEQLG